MRSVLKFWQKITEQGLGEGRGLIFWGSYDFIMQKLHTRYIAVNACLGWLNNLVV